MRLTIILIQIIMNFATQLVSSFNILLVIDLLDVNSVNILIIIQERLSSSTPIMSCFSSLSAKWRKSIRSSLLRHYCYQWYSTLILRRKIVLILYAAKSCGGVSWSLQLCLSLSNYWVPQKDRLCRVGRFR